ncbi:uncharacterized protein N7487_002508 [Penicillium crustosum]|uniref:uncharacterized protein n=1 Tax=Penicillium crustosum TaxID=36656 RepID=UPI0023820A29|nr:uncharacterized protein N7487_002508 [Penicillium crustosum]KAJ5418958.1 hypothetical protein N7487_002508 [Penicillium crustosum]
MAIWKREKDQKQTQRFPIEVAEAFEPEDDLLRQAQRTGSPPGNLLCMYPDAAPGTSLNQFRFQLHRENGVQPGLVGYLEKYVGAAHLVWSMCALLADSGIDPEWKDTFEVWRPQWRQFATSFEIQGNTSRTLNVPPRQLENKRDRDALDDLWKWMLDVPPEAIVNGVYIIKLGVEPWFPGE